MSTLDRLISRRQFGRLGATAAFGLSGVSLMGQAAAPPLKSEFVMDLIFKTGPGAVVGNRRISSITEGTFQGPKLKGKVITPAGEWGATRPSDGAYLIDVRMELQTDDEATIYANYRGIIHTPQGQGQDKRYWVTQPVFETAAPKYDWLNRAVCIAVDYVVPREVGNVAYHVYQILMS